MDIVVLAGGLSTERDVSFQSGKRIAEALRRHDHRAILLDVFLGYGEEGDDIDDLFERELEVSVEVGEIPTVAPDLEAVRRQRKDQGRNFFGPNVIALCQRADIVFIALHGADGENGKLQAAFDLLGIRYTGNGFLSCALAMDKGIAKHFFYYYGIPCPQGFTVQKNGYNREKVLDQTVFPCVVKPVGGGSSVGVTIVHNEEDYEAAIEEAFRYEEEIMVEDYIEGREFSVGVLDGVALPVVEIKPKHGFYDYANKYKAGMTEEICPAQLDDELTSQMQLYAERVVAALGLETYSRMDFILDANNEIYCLEANTLPGMTPTSLLPQEAQAIGISYSNLCEEIIQISMERFNA
ncbi:MAG: D-alanine--D-alanine ligase [Selenomonadaceae bacterium]|nr:D-alanine--D-alanine ligase [Selenomonadaceae bacterium]